MRHPQTQGKVERFHGELQRALARRRCWCRTCNAGWTSFAGSTITCDPHEALDMQTPASRWRPSVQRYHANPPRMGISGGSAGVESDCTRQTHAGGKELEHQQCLGRRTVQVMQLEQRLQVYYCTTLVREIDLGIQRSTMVERWIPS